MKNLVNLLTQIKNKSINQFLPEDTYNMYKHLYKYKLEDPHVKTLLKGIEQEVKENILEKYLISLFFMNRISVKDIYHRIYILEYFPLFCHLIEGPENILHKLIIQYYLLETSKSEDKNIINGLVPEFINDLVNPKDNKIVLFKEDINSFLIYYNTKSKILIENNSTVLINLMCKYMTDLNIELLYDVIEDKSVINIEINRRKIFDRLKHKIIRDTLITSYTLINLKVKKKDFYKILNNYTMVYKDLLEINFKKYLEILKIIPYNQKYILLIEWMKTFIYFGRFDLFIKLYKNIKIKKKFPKNELDLFSTLYRCIKKNGNMNLNPFLLKILYTFIQRYYF
ncbi:hypothetical protein P3W45_001134 [Vairimorpha bombi]